MRSRGGRRVGSASSVQDVLMQMLSQCGALRLPRGVVLQQLHRLAVLEATAALEGAAHGTEGLF